MSHWNLKRAARLEYLAGCGLSVESIMADHVIATRSERAVPQSDDWQTRPCRYSQGHAAMNLKQILFFSASMLASSVCGFAAEQEPQGQYVQIAEIEIDPAQLEDYKSAVREQIETAVSVEPGVLVLYAVSEKDNPTHIRVFEIYRDVDAYKSHLESAHFKKYKATSEKMVKSLKLVQTAPIMLGAKAK